MLSRPLYQPLRSGEIRLLTICSQSSFTLENVSLRDNPNYAAISYCWGDVEDLCTVRVNDFAVQLRENVYDMLGILHHKHQATRVWLDIISINQNDIDEKSKQVPRMGEIFGQATTVYAWLGEADCQTDIVFDVLRDFRYLKRHRFCPTKYDADQQLSYNRRLFRHIYLNRSGAFPEQSDLDNDMTHEEFNWLRPLYIRPFWRRVWIVQELVLAKKVVVCCGDKSIDFDDIYGLSHEWGSSDEGFGAKAYQKLKPHTMGWGTIQGICGHRRRKWEPIGMRPRHAKVELDVYGGVATLDEVIGTYAKHHECKLPKDRIYGFRELVPQWKGTLEVDYKRSDLEVFLDATKLGLLEPFKHGGWNVGLDLWLAMGLGDGEKFNDFV